MSQPIKTLSLDRLDSLVADAGLPKFRSSQIANWLYSKGATSYDEMSNIPKSMREQMAREYPLYTPSIVDKRVSADGSRKYLLKFHDDAVVETVGLPSNDGRLTVCCSSQAGCSMRCAFCATGRNGLTRSLEPGEIVDQILAVQNDFGNKVTNVVVMGQGEPFANYDNTIAALRIINHPQLLNIGARHITVSTCGLIGGITRFSEEPEQFTLAVSLHAACQETRDSLMPAVKNQSLAALREALIQYADATGRRFSFEYALMKGINDSADDVHALISYCRHLLCHVNLIPLNEIEGSPFKPVSRETVSMWRDMLDEAGIAVSIRNSRGSDISAACGQLAGKYQLATN